MRRRDHLAYELEVASPHEPALQVVVPGGEPFSESTTEPKADPAQSSAIAYAIFVAIAMGTAFALRLNLVLTHPFAIVDGGMFYTMVQNLLAHGLLIPRFTTYNSAHIPFSYPPLGLYAVAVLHLLGWSLMELFRFFPLVVSVLAVGAFALLARALVTTRAAIVATFVFAFLPDAFESQVRGGGVTRAPGQLFALLALHQVVRMYQDRNRRRVVPAALFCACTAMSHLEWMLFAAVGILLLAVFFGRSRHAIISAVMVASLTAIFLAPWAGDVIAQHGIQPFLLTVSGSSSVWPWYQGLIGLLTLKLVNETWLPIASILGLLGCVSCVHRRYWFLPVWLLATTVTDPRVWELQALIPVSLLAGIGLETAVATIALHAGHAGRVRDARVPRRWKLATAGVIGFLMIQMVLGAWVQESLDGTSLTRPQYAAMLWAGSHTSVSSRFLVVSSNFWAVDALSEWFPTLSGRESISTVQGYEWIPGAFSRRTGANMRLQSCASGTAARIQQWLNRNQESANYLFISKANAPFSGYFADCCSGLRSSVNNDPSYRMVFQNAGAAIYRRV